MSVNDQMSIIVDLPTKHIKTTTIAKRESNNAGILLGLMLLEKYPMIYISNSG